MAQLPDKVLRIGVVLDGRIVHERLIRPGSDVTLGESARNTFVLPPLQDMPKRVLLFPRRKKGWSLRFHHGMSGKVARGTSIVPLEALMSEAREHDDAFVVPLDNKARGKIQVHERVAVLFQFVPAPAEASRISEKTFRPKLLDEDDPVYLGFLGLFSAAAAVAMIWVWGQTPIERVGFEGIEDRFVHDVLIIQAPEPDPVEIEPILQDDAEPEPEPDQAVLHDDAPPEPLYEGSENPATQTALQQVEEHPLIASLGGSNGFEVGRDSIFDPDDTVEGELWQSLSAVTGEDLAMGDGPGIVGCEGCTTEDEGIGALGPAGRVGPARIHKGTLTTDPSRDSITEVDPDPARTGPDIGGLLKAFDPHIRTCYEQGLNRSSTLAGRVELALGIDDGVTYGVQVLVNTTNDAKLSQCIESKAQRWKFPEEIEADVVKNYVLTPME